MFPRITHPCATLINWCKHQLNPVQLACVKPAASVRSEPGSNSHIKWLFILSAITHKRIFLRFLYDTPDFISFFILLQSTSAILSAYPLIFCLFTLLYNSLAGTLPRSVSPCIWHHPPLVNTILIFFSFFLQNYYKWLLFLKILYEHFLRVKSLLVLESVSFCG